MERLKQFTMEPHIRMMKSDWTRIGDFPLGNSKHPALPMSRPALHELLYDYARELGIPVALGKSVVEYFEDSERGGVTYADGSTEVADIVVAADGVGSRAWALVTGEKQAATPSGFSVHLVTYPTERALANPVVKEGFGDLESGVMFNLGPGAHFVIGKSPKETTWCLITRDQPDATEDWGNKGSAAAALAEMESWAPFYKELVKTAPEDDILLWRLMWRDPQPKCVSPLGRVVQIGDAAHPFLPTSAAGASMALEDGCTLASCLQLSGKSNVPLALRVHNLLRFERVCCAQKIGFRNREMFHKTDWDGVENDPGSVSVFAGDWMGRHHVEQYVYDNYGNAARSILEGTHFENTNSVPGFKFRPWTVKELLEASDKGQPVIDEGEWY
ncbi:hypothetical protein BFW01_g1961 [Lasiodiplodia theobromae]|nr:hypothetical protein BFW01_g1961 [Lasiodiplodia theobromae]